MKRKTTFIIMLLLCLSAGVAACIFAFQSNIVPTISTVSAPAKHATLSAPVGGEEEKKEAVLPALPTLPDSSVDSSDKADDANIGTETVVENTGENTSPEPRYSYTASHSSQRLFVREAPSLRAKIIGALQPGDSGEVVLVEPAWVLVKYKETEGYVFKEYLTLTELPQ